MSEEKHEHDGEHSQEHPHPHNDEPHGHEHGGGGAHGHTHGIIDASITASERGLWAVKQSFIGLGITTVIQIAIFYQTAP